MRNKTRRQRLDRVQFPIEYAMTAVFWVTDTQLIPGSTHATPGYIGGGKRRFIMEQVLNQGGPQHDTERTTDNAALTQLLEDQAGRQNDIAQAES